MRTAIRLLLVALAVAGSVFLAKLPGTVVLHWQDWEVRTSLAIAVATLIISFVLLWLLIDIVRRIATAPARLSRRRREARRLQGYRALTDGLVSVASGDLATADRHARRAEKAFRIGRHEPPPLTRLLAAQTAWLRGEHDTAKSGFTALLDHGETRFLGLRGLIVHALREGDHSGALRMAELAEAERPNASWALRTRLELEARSGNWRAAFDTLDRARRRGAIPAEDAHRHRVAILLARSADATADGRHRDALTYAATACRQAPAFAPAALAYAGLLVAANQANKARRVLESAWKRASHPALAAAFERLIEQEQPLDRLKRFEKFVASRPHDPEGHLSAAAMALSAHLWGEAGRHLQLAGAGGPGPWHARLCRLSIELATALPNGAATARVWSERVQHAPADAAWVCRQCAAEAENWQPLCPSCDGFDALVWRTPDHQPPSNASLGLAPATHSALPLLDPPILAPR